ncbi:MAG: Beta-ketoadipate enol-lactone hydrolase [uncultured Thermoleophilia bacterium]|uniref:Beta-ketoadipate enol-lactone hydrolase n=1 Tax=uncultured Thermoleophilia bacterium TaxID=1497501 RepID=A0A6J4TG56_9ACTN|nr:MAG: Beta-ketoadipate enol-lactone hydrolase [uncultured Thermoleophilia bacterium]
MTEPMRRPTILLLHAFPLGGGMWDHARAALEARGWPVATPDLSGPDARSSYGETATRLLEDVAGDLVLVGASMGGHLAFELWRRAASRIRGLALCDTRATPDTAEQRASRDALIRVLEEGGVEGLATGPMATMGEPALRLMRELPADGLIATLRAMRDRPDSSDTLATIDVPVLVLTGAEDPVVRPEQARALAAALPGSRYVEIPSAGHVPALEQPEAFTAALVSFLEEAVRPRLSGP